jgi:hypothetical protein
VTIRDAAPGGPVTGMEPEQAEMMSAAHSAQHHSGAALHWWLLPQVTGPLLPPPAPPALAGGHAKAAPGAFPAAPVAGS